jgi:hypothetical protein
MSALGPQWPAARIDALLVMACDSRAGRAVMRPLPKAG